MTESDVDRWRTLRQAGVALVLDVGGPHLPRIVHWGANLAT
ncbi:MAG TPA: hypothetical protein VN738_05800 [Acidothermaceae bacterium]|nr:hypothetical protein [Acidothermaceae bacterium]